MLDRSEKSENTARTSSWHPGFVSRVAIKLRGAINHLQQCEETDFAGEWTRTEQTVSIFGIRFGIQFQASSELSLGTEIDGRPQAKFNTSSFDPNSTLL